MKKTPDFKLQAVTEGTKWPYLGNAWTNSKGSISVLLDRRIKIVLPDGTELQATDDKALKLLLRTPRAKASTGEAA